jgi:hypothetical protein
MYIIRGNKMYQLKVTLVSDNGAHWRINNVFYLTDQSGEKEKPVFVSQKDRDRILNGSFLFLNKLQYDRILEIVNWANLKGELIENKDFGITENEYLDLLKINSIVSIFEPMYEELVATPEVNIEEQG